MLLRQPNQTFPRTMDQPGVAGKGDSLLLAVAPTMVQENPRASPRQSASRAPRSRPVTPPPGARSLIRQRLGPRANFWLSDGLVIPPGRSAIAELYPALWSRGFAREGRTADQHDAFCIAAWHSRPCREWDLASFLNPGLAPPDSYSFLSSNLGPYPFSSIKVIPAASSAALIGRRAPADTSPRKSEDRPPLVAWDIQELPTPATSASLYYSTENLS